MAKKGNRRYPIGKFKDIPRIEKPEVPIAEKEYYTEPGKISGGTKENYSYQRQRNTRRGERQNRYKSEREGKYFPGSRFKAMSEFLATEDDTEYMFFDTRSMNDAQYLADAALKCVEYGSKLGHWDERVAAQETAFDTYFQELTELIIHLMPMNVIHDYLKSFPLDTTNAITIGNGATGQTHVPLYSKMTIADIVEDLVNCNIMVPSFLVKFIKAINLYII